MFNDKYLQMYPMSLSLDLTQGLLYVSAFLTSGLDSRASGIQ
jgi:hypothetical protein